jgi:predicted O-methyltransferase YrrM
VLKTWRDALRATRHEIFPISRNLARAALRNRSDALVELREAVVQKWERTQPLPEYHVDADWDRLLHELLGAPWPCPEVAVSAQVYAEAVNVLREQGIVVGPDAFVGWADGDPATSRALWCVTRHLRPTNVVETGVARGVTTRIILEALERNGHGRLWSIDLPPQMRPQHNEEIGAAVPHDRRNRWTLVQGSSRQRLPPLLARLESIELFAHDSRHTSQNLRFELAQAWAHLAVGGIVVADDVDLNQGLPRFLATTHGHQTLIAPAEVADETRRYGRDLFALIRKAVAD